jgi:Ran GTPase-activating protein (RanGAP) involved in mRNA processing and transport
VLNNTSLGDKGLNFMLDAVNQLIKEEIQSVERRSSERSHGCVPDFCWEGVGVAKTKLEDFMTNQRVSLSHSQLQILEIQRNDISFSKETVENLNYILRYGNLIILDISFNNLGDVGTEKLSRGLAGKISLRKLLMEDCKIG